jgi:hypothetical protein
MEYMGYYCHQYSPDYIFIPTSYCRIESQMRKMNPELYFMQNWSHGGIDENSRAIINNVLNNNTIFKEMFTRIDFRDLYSLADPEKCHQERRPPRSP